jgi:hypothetical protein
MTRSVVPIAQKPAAKILRSQQVAESSAFTQVTSDFLFDTESNKVQLEAGRDVLSQEGA